MQSSWAFFLSQLVSQLPVLLVYLVGIIVAAMWMRRIPLAALLVLIGLALMLVTTIGQSMVTNYVISNRGSSNVSTGSVLAITSLVTAIIRAAGLAMVVAAVFTNRPPVDAALQSGFEVR